MLDDYALVSNSDSHSPTKLGREATCFDTELSYAAILDAVKSRDPKQLTGTFEFFPEGGKYHHDGHRKCGVRLAPRDSIELGGLCPKCEKPMTIDGVRAGEVQIVPGYDGVFGSITAGGEGVSAGEDAQTLSGEAFEKQGRISD